MSDQEFLAAFIDGGSRGNPGNAGAGVHLELNGIPWRGLYRYLGSRTNNYAEYSALLQALQYTLQHGYRKIRVYSDSELLVRQILGQYRVKNPVLQELYREAKALIQRLDAFKIQHIPREQNQLADGLANRAQDEMADGEVEYPEKKPEEMKSGVRSQKTE
jgi:ribonuclease HI